MIGPDEEDYAEPPFICPVTSEACVRAFCEDYGCATKANVPVDDYDLECGSLHPDELALRLPKAMRIRKRKRP